MIILGAKEKPTTNRLFPVLYEHISKLEVGECLYIEREIQFEMKSLSKIHTCLLYVLGTRNERGKYHIESVYHPLKNKFVTVPPTVLKITKRK